MEWAHYYLLCALVTSLGELTDKSELHNTSFFISTFSFTTDDPAYLLQEKYASTDIVKCKPKNC